MVMKLNNEFNFIAKELFTSQNLEVPIDKTIKFLENYLDVNISMAAKYLLKHLANNEDFVSSYEIKCEAVFCNFSIRIEDILKELSKRNFILKKSRKLGLGEKERLIGENVYAIR